MMFDLTNDRKSMKSLIGQKKKKISSHKDMIMHFSGFFSVMFLWMCFAMKICWSCRSSQSPICNFIWVHDWIIVNLL